MLPHVAHLFGHDADCPAVDQRIAHVAVVKENRPVEGRDAHTVAVIGHPGAHPFENPPRMQDTLGQFFIREVRRSKTEDIGIQNRFGPQTGPQRIADNAADTGRSPAVGFDGGGMVVGLHLETKGPVAVEINHPGVVLKNGKTPGFIQFVGCFGDGAFQQVIDHLAFKRNLALEGLVAAVFRPCLGEGLDLGIGRVAFLFGEVIDNSFQFFMGKAVFPPDLSFSRLVGIENADPFQAEFITGVFGKGKMPSFYGVLDDGIDQQPLRYLAEFGRGGAAVEEIKFTGLDGLDTRVSPGRG